MVATLDVDQTDRGRHGDIVYGSLVRSARLARHLTQPQLAELSGIEQANISAIETGRRSPTAATLHRLVHACGFELVASAGTRQLACPPPQGDDWFDALIERHPTDEQPTVTRETPIDVRARVLTAALDSAEAIVRGRG